MWSCLCIISNQKSWFLLLWLSRQDSPCFLLYNDYPLGENGYFGKYTNALICPFLQGLPFNNFPISHFNINWSLALPGKGNTLFFIVALIWRCIQTCDAFKISRDHVVILTKLENGFKHVYKLKIIAFANVNALIFFIFHVKQLMFYPYYLRN